MNRIAKVLALVMALVMLMSCAASAESDSTVYTIAAMDPVVLHNGEVLYDLTGLDMELSAAVTDLGVLGILLGCYAGENLDMITSAQLQLDENGLSGYLDGMSAIYGVNASSVDMLMGEDGFTASYLSLPYRTMLAASSGNSNLPADWRFLILRELFSGLEIASDTQGEVIHSFHFDRERASEAVAAAAALMDQYSTGSEVNFSDMLEKYNLSFEISGTVTAASGSGESAMSFAAIDAQGLLFLDTRPDSVPFTVEYNDSIDSAYARFVLDPEGDRIVAEGRFSPVPGSNQIDGVVSVSVPSADLYIDAEMNNSGSDVSFAFNATYTAEETIAGIYVSYVGENVQDDAVDYHLGTLVLGGFEGEDAYDVTVDVILMEQEASTGAWVLDTSEAIDLLSLDEAGKESAYLDLIIQGSGALSELQQLVPGLNAILDIEQNAEPAA